MVRPQISSDCNFFFCNSRCFLVSVEPCVLSGLAFFFSGVRRPKKKPTHARLDRNLWKTRGNSNGVLSLVCGATGEFHGWGPRLNVGFGGSDCLRPRWIAMWTSSSAYRPGYSARKLPSFFSYSSIMGSHHPFFIRHDNIQMAQCSARSIKEEALKMLIRFIVSVPR